MSRMNFLLFPGSLVLAIALAPAVARQSAADGPYHYLKTIKIGGEEAGDYGRVDAAGRRLYWSHGNKVVVIDIDKDTVVGEIADTPGVHGIAIARELGLVFTTNGGENKASIVDLKTYATKMKVDTDQDPDPVLYDPSRKEVYTFNGRGGTATVFEAQSGKVVASIKLPGKAESAAIDVKVGRIYNVNESANEVTVIDTKTHTIVDHWPIAPGERASGIAIDVDNHRLFIAATKLLVVMNYDTGKVVTTIPIGAEQDGAIYDPVHKLVFASCGEGTLTVAHVDSPDKLSIVQVVKTAENAETMAFDPQTRKVYLAAADFTPPPPPPPDSPAKKGGRGGPAGHPKVVPGSFRILVYGTNAK
jgi:DNA-binding beta-propeller fold protein YncE